MTNLRLPTLIQRMSRRREDRQDSKGVDKLFELDYMGSSEFEFGTVFKALKAMREARDAAKNKDWMIRTISIGESTDLDRSGGGCTCYYIGAPETLSIATQLFEDQLRRNGERQHRPKEWTYLYETYFPEPGRNHLGPYHGWWALDAEPTAFVIFKDKKHAQDFKSVL